MQEIENEKDNADNRELLVNIFNISATMVGVCLTAMGIIGVGGHLKGIIVYTDKLLSVNSLFYIVSCLTAYSSIRSKNDGSLGKNRKYKLERFADITFIISIIITFLACILLVVEFS